MLGPVPPPFAAGRTSDFGRPATWSAPARRARPGPASWLPGIAPSDCGASRLSKESGQFCAPCPREEPEFREEKPQGGTVGMIEKSASSSDGQAPTENLERKSSESSLVIG